MDPLADRDPRQVGSFEILGRLGAGGMGSVLLGRSASGRKVAVKVVHEHLARDPTFRARFAREVAAARRVSGLYTAEVVDADPAAAAPWMATRFVEGPSLAQRVAADGPLPPSEVRSIGAGVSEALMSIHAAGLVHRDLKPANVLLAEDGPHVIDFGIADVQDSTALTGSGALLGTLEYISPEQVAGTPVTAATDVFCLGGLLCFAATGRPPFGRGPAAALMHRVATSDPDLSDVRDDELRRLLARCLAKDPAKRPTTAQVLAAVTGTPPGHPARPSRPGLPNRLSHAGRPSRRAVLTGGVLATAAGAVGVPLAVRALRPDRPQRTGTGATASGAPWTGAGTGPIAIAGHPGHLDDVAFSPDGRTLAVAARNGTAVLVDVATGRNGFVLRGHTAAVSSVAFSAGGRVVATGSDDRTAILWDATTGRPTRTLSGHGAAVTDVLCLPRADRPADAAGVPPVVTTSLDGTARIWPADGSAARVLPAHTPGVHAAACTRDGRLLATGGADATARIWDVATGRVRHVLKHPRAVTAVAFSPDGRILTTGGADGNTREWDVASGAPVLAVGTNGPTVTSVAYAPDGGFVASGSLAGEARIWLPATGQTVSQLSGHTAAVNAVAWPPGGGSLATVGSDGSLRLWDTSTGTQRTALTPAPGRTFEVVFGRDGRRYATAGADGTVRLWDNGTGAAVRAFGGPPAGPVSPVPVVEVRAVDLSPDGRTVAGARADGTVHLWDVGTGSVRVLAGHTGPVHAVRFTPDGRTLATAGEDRTVRWWDVAAATAGRVATGHTARVTTLDVSPDGATLVTAGDDGTIRGWDVAGGAGRVLADLGGAVRVVRWAPDGATVLVIGGGADGTGAAHLRDARTGTPVRALAGSGATVTTAAFAPDGRTVAGGGTDRTVRIWDVATGALRHTLPQRTAPVGSLAYAVDGRSLITAATDGVDVREDLTALS